MTTIKLKNGSGAPTAGDLVQGEPALDLTNKRLYTEDSGGTVIEVGTNPGEDVTFADNRKAVFGAGSDLQIFHNGSRSVITDQGTGPLRISATNLEFKNADDTKLYANAIDGGAFNIYYDNAKKLETTSTGIDVTGGIAATDDSTFTAASGDIYVTASTGSGSGRSGFRVDETANNGFEIAHDNADNAFFISRRSGSSTVVDALKIDRSTGDFSLFEDTGTTAKLFWDASAERLGIGNSSPSTALDVTGTVTADGLTVDGNSSFTGDFEISGLSPKIFLNETDTTDVNSRIRSSGGKLEIQTVDNSDANPVTRFEINHSTGNVSIPSGDLDVTGTVTADTLDVDDLKILSGQSTTPTNDSSPLIYKTTSHSDYANGDLIIQARSSASRDIYMLTGTTTPVNRLQVNGNGDISFYEDTGTTAKLFWDASAESLGIGTSSPSNLVHLQSSLDTLLKIESTDTVVRLDLTDSGGTSLIQNTSGKLVLQADNANAVANSYLGFEVDGSEAMRIDSDGNVGIGTSPSQPLHVDATEGTTAALFDNNGTNGDVVRVGKNGTDILKIRAEGTADVALDANGGAFIFKEGGVEAARFTASGNLLVGTTANAMTAGGVRLKNGGGNLGEIALSNNSGSADYVARFLWGSTPTLVGNITVSSSATTYNTSSDQRLKENIVDAPSASDDIDAIQVRSFDWKADGSHQKYGMVAQELQGVAPEAVTGDADSDEMMGVDYSKLVPMMIKEIQSLRREVAALKENN